MLPHNHDGVVTLFRYFNNFEYQQHRQGNKQQKLPEDDLMEDRNMLE
jgi:hypothetical protein